MTADRPRRRLAKWVGRACAAGLTLEGMLASTLRGNYALLTTFRRSGQEVATTVWFALARDDRAYFFTGPETGKARRIRANAHVKVAPSTPRGKATGPAVDATARLLNGAEADLARQTIRKKYGIQWTIFGWFARLRGFKNQVFYELTSS